MKYRVSHIVMVFALLVLAVIPSMAQPEETPNTLSFNDFSFSYPQNWVTTIITQLYAGDPVETAGPGFSDAGHVAFTLYDPYPPEGEFDQKGGIKLYTVEEIAKYDFLQAELEELQALLAEKPDLEAYEAVNENVISNALPYIPVLPHGQIIRAQAEYVETEHVRGIRFITSHRADAGPFLTGDLTYAFQGISTNGEYYISASFPLITTLFPAELPADYDPADFEVQPYLEEAVELIDGASSDQFSPSLDWLDGIVESFSFAD